MKPLLLILFAVARNVSALLVSGALAQASPQACQEAFSNKCTLEERDAQSTYNDTALIDYDGTPLNARTPLILIHGIHGNQPPCGGADVISQPSTRSWKHFRDAFSTQSSFNAQYKVYEFHYVSDKYPLPQVACALRQRLDGEPTLRDRRIVIVAHSMGGLVARAYMNQCHHQQGDFKGKLGGQRVDKLITLGTPHHGTPAANDKSRDQLATNEFWKLVLGLASFSFWKGGLVESLKERELQFVFYWEPNRVDLLWDNFDGRFDCDNADLNCWLDTLNKSDLYLSKTVAYYGYVLQSDPFRRAIIELNGISDSSPGSMVAAALGYSAYCVLDLDPDIAEHRLLSVANITMDFGMSRVYSYNDGFVPWESAAFKDFNILKRVECSGFDHLEAEGQPWQELLRRTKFVRSFGR